MSAPLLSAQDLTLRYPGADAPAVVGADFTLEPGESVGLVGESGSGKTTLARALVGVLPAAQGSAEVQGKPWSALRGRDPLRRSVQMIFQDPYGSLNPSLTPRRAVAEVLGFWDGLGSREAQQGAELKLAEVGLAGAAIDRLPSRLSGGERQRTGIARALACRPEVVVADEPTASLDVSVQAQILNVLDELRTAHRLALLLVSHDLAVVRHMTDRVVVMYGGRIVEQGPTEELFAAPQHPYTQILLDSIPGRRGAHRLNRHEDLPPHDGCGFAQRCPRLGERCTTQRPVLTDAPHAWACHFPSDG